jgi:sulfate adenylyltransferase
MRMAGPREAVLHALIRKNYGCTHFIVGRDHAGPSKRKKDGTTYFGPYDAQDLLKSVSEELGIEIVTSEFIVYEPETSKYYQLSKVPKGLTPLNISGTQLRQALHDGTEIPEWFSFKDVVEILRKSVKKGFCMYFTGLSGSGKSTLANALKVRLEEFMLEKEVTILDGDQIRLHLSKGLTFSKEDRSMNVRRIGYVASEIVKHGGICLVANIAPFKEDRDWNREMISKYGGYFEVFVSTSLEQCEKRDLKGLYKMAREGKIKKFTGISDPYEEPDNADFVINSSDSANIADLVQYLIDGMKVRGYIGAGDGLY